MNAEFLAEWVAKATTVDKYCKDNKEIYFASKGNEHLIFTCHRVRYTDSCPHVNIVWIKDGVSELVYQDILCDKFEEVIHRTGNIEGKNGVRENIETIWVAIHEMTK